MPYPENLIRMNEAMDRLKPHIDEECKVFTQVMIDDGMLRDPFQAYCYAKGFLDGKGTSNFISDEFMEFIKNNEYKPWKRAGDPQ